MTKVKLKDLIAPSFYKVHQALKRGRYTHYWLKGGRGSTKSTFASVEIILGMMQDPEANATVLRKVGAYLKDSVYEQLAWAIDKLGSSEYWHMTKSPMEMTYQPTGQKILFRGADAPRKIKSTKFSQGYGKYIWYEEVDEFHGMEEIRTINQLLMRGGPRFVVFYSFNPPASVRNWVNDELLINRPDRLVHHSTYLHVKEFIAKTKPLALEVQAKYGVPYGVCIAQAALETGWGLHVKGNNYFAIKGQGQKFATHEFVDGKRINIIDSFRAYDSMGDSFKDYGKFLSTQPRYANAFKTNEPGQFAQELQKAGYATDPEYANKLISNMRRWNLI